MLKITNIKVPLGSEFYAIENKVSKTLGVTKGEIEKITILKKSQDKRQKGNPLNVYSLIVTLKSENEEMFCNNKNVSIYKPKLYQPMLSKVKGEKVAVVGFGPCGMFASLILAKAGLVPVVFEQGEEIEKRIETVEALKTKGDLNVNSNIQFGEGGAGTFSDGKLNTNVKDERINYIFKEFVKFGADESILVDSKPHIGTDKLVEVVANLRNEVISLGGKVNFNSKIIDFNKDENISLLIEKDGNTYREDFKYVIFATGHSARDTFFMIHKNGVKLQPKPFSVGFRIEHKQEFINMCQYKNTYKKEENLPSAEYKLNSHLKNGRGVYTFCMCPGGEVLPSMSEENTVVTNGMSTFGRNFENANSAVLVSVDVKDYDNFRLDENTPNELLGVDFQRTLERLAFSIGGGNYYAPCQLAEDFIKGVKTTRLKGVQPSYKPGVNFVDFNEHLPKFLCDSLKEGLVDFDKRIKGFTKNGSVLTGFETRSSSPVKIDRDEKMFSNIEGIVFAGEGSGYAGGITTSAIEGIKSAENVILHIGNFAKLK